MRILVVDDEALTCVSTVELLSKAGHTAVAFQNAQSAIEILEKLPFHVVITDLRMPGMDGISLLKHIQTAYPAVFVIAMTAYWTCRASEEAADYGVYDTLEKPFRFERLTEILEGIEKHVCEDGAVLI